MVVATGTGDGQPKESLCGRIDALIDGVIDVLEALADGQEAEGGETRIIRRDARDAVGGELLDDELVVRLVVVDRVDHVIAIGPGIREAIILEERVTHVDLQAAGIGIAGGIEPVAGPAFAEVRRSQQFVDALGVDRFDTNGRLASAQGHRVGKLRRLDRLFKGVHLFGGGRKADQVIGDAAEKGFRASRRIRLEALLLELSEDEGIDGSLDPRLVLHLGHSSLLDRQEGPMFASLTGESGNLSGAARRHGRTHLNPLLEEGDLVIG